MNQNIRTVLLIIFFFVGCKKDSNPISTVSTEPSLLIDTLNFNGIVKTGTSIDSAGTYISYRLAYHFMGRPGSLDGISFSADDFGSAIIFEPYSPTPVGLQLAFSDKLKYSSTFPGQDSLFIRIGLEGRFWERKDATVINYGTFSIRDSLWVKLQR